MKKIHTEAKKANRGKRGDTPTRGLEISAQKIEVVTVGFKKELATIPARILNHTLIQPRTGKPAFLRRNSLIKKQD